MNLKQYIKIIIIFLLFGCILKAAESDGICFDCHTDKSLTKMRNGKNISLFIDQKNFNKSIHTKDGCIGCHSDINPDDLPHPEELKKVNCAKCHEKAVNKYKGSLHGAAHDKGKYLAPTCQSCHSKHGILSSKDPNSKTYVMNIPNLCGECHKEGTPVSKLQFIKQKHILENYSQSLHAQGLYKQGLTVTAVCTSCHMSHDILPHENPKSSINRFNISKTCMQCHTLIEKVHAKVIEGKLWEKKPHSIPVCVDCHQPHKTRKVIYDNSYPNDFCMKCHSNKAIFKTINDRKINLFVDESNTQHSVHKDLPCIKCHTNIKPEYKPVCVNSGKVDCSMCHAEQVGKYENSRHGALHYRGNKNAPYCTDCHGVHEIKSHEDLTSQTFAQYIPKLCGKCHREGKQATLQYKGPEHSVVEKYSLSIHGKGLMESGLVVTATCVDCHTSHSELPANDPNSTVNKEKISATCGKCHLGIYEQLQMSVHSPLVTKTNKKLPVCFDCHFAHTINRVDAANFRTKILGQCGKCHKDVAESYFDTFHGKVSKLGSDKTAKCSDCHGAHNILPVSNPESLLSRGNIVKTCKKCHTNSNRKFVGYLTHATHHNRDKYPFLFYTFWFMTLLLVGTFSFFGMHTLLWIPRSILEKRKMMREKNE